MWTSLSLHMPQACRRIIHIWKQKKLQFVANRTAQIQGDKHNTHDGLYIKLEYYSFKFQFSICTSNYWKLLCTLGKNRKDVMNWSIKGLHRIQMAHSYHCPSIHLCHKHKNKAKNELPPGKHIAKDITRGLTLFLLYGSNPPSWHPPSRGSLDGKTPLWGLIWRNASPLLARTISFFPSLARVWRIHWSLQATMSLVAATAICIIVSCVRVMHLGSSSFLLTIGGIPRFSRIWGKGFWTWWTARLRRVGWTRACALFLASAVWFITISFLCKTSSSTSRPSHSMLMSWFMKIWL